MSRKSLFECWRLPAAIAVLMALTTCLSAQEGRPRFRPPAISPEADDQGNVTFRIRAENATAIRIESSDMPGLGQGGLSLTKGEENVWAATAEKVAPGTYRYRFNVDGLSVMDPSSSQISESNGNAWSVVHVAGSEWMDNKSVPHGAIAEVQYHSKPLDRHRRMHVYTPPGYEAGDAKYPVFYLLHGASDSDDSWSTVGRAGFILDNLIASGDAVPMIVVMPAGHTGPFMFGRDQLPVDEFTQDFEEAIVPYIEANYRVKEGQANRAIAGLSMGGAQTLNVAVRNLDDYAYIGVYSSGVFGIDRRGPGQNDQPAWDEKHAAALDDAQLKAGIKLVWFATGKDDFLLQTSRATVEMLKKHGFEVTYKETEGGHTWINWREYLREYSQALFQAEG